MALDILLTLTNPSSDRLNKAINLSNTNLRGVAIGYGSLMTSPLKLYRLPSAVEKSYALLYFCAGLSAQRPVPVGRLPERPCPSPGPPRSYRYHELPCFAVFLTRIPYARAESRTMLSPVCLGFWLARAVSLCVRAAAVTSTCWRAASRHAGKMSAESKFAAPRLRNATGSHPMTLRPSAPPAPRLGRRSRVRQVQQLV